MSTVTVQTRAFGDRFQIVSESGTGGMGTVYRATDSLTGQTVALKVLHDQAGSSVERFNQEAALLADLAHPSIVRYVDHGVTVAGEPYIAMEWLEGETLEKRLARGPLGIIESLRLARRVLDGLAVAHAKGIVHRDLKPANLFLPEGDLAQVKLLDFGIARRVFDTRRLTMSGAALGTPMYMSPEQVRGGRVVDGRSDIFSLGSLLYECIAGEPPFAGDTPMAILAKICLASPVDVAERLPDLPAPLAATLEQMLAKDPEQRPASAAELSVEIAALIQKLIDSGVVTGVIASDATSRSASPAIATGEQRVVSAILVARPRAGGVVIEDDSARVGTWDVPSSATRHTLADIFDEATFAKIEKTIAPFGAHADRFLGSSMVVTLVGKGTPTDQAAQAARCALKLKALLPRVAFSVSTGRGFFEGKVPLGEVIDDAARLISGEQPGSIRVDDLTASLLGARFEIQTTKGPRRIPTPATGRDLSATSAAATSGDGVERKHLLFEKGLEEAPRTVLGKEIPCVGRERELSTLGALWEESSGEPVARAVLLTAPAGGGKSRVRHELLDRIQARGEPFELMIGRGEPLRAGAPFAMIGPALRAAAGLVGGEVAAVAQKRLLAHVERHVAPEISRRVAAFLGEIADIPFPDDDLPPLKAARQDPRLMADQTLGAWLDFLEAECNAGPVLLVLEDLHWGDAPSIQLIDAALRTLRERPLMILAFARPEVDDKFPNLWAERDLQRMSLPPLTAKSAQKLVRAILADLPPEKATWIVERADGNPFYLEELVRAVGTNGDTAAHEALPQTVLGMVQARFDALGPAAKRVLRAAAIFGSNFRSAGISVLIGGDEDRSLDQWLDILSQKEVLFPRQAADTREFVFRHALLQEAAYDMLTEDARVLGHRLAGEFLESIGEKEAIVLVEHFERGGELKKAAHWCRFAAEQALDANDLKLTIERAQRGVALGATDVVLGATRLVEARAHFYQGEYSQAEVSAESATKNLAGPARFAAIEELVAALGQRARYADVEHWTEYLYTVEGEADDKSNWLGCLLRAAYYLLNAGRYQEVRDLLCRLESSRHHLDVVRLVRLENLKAHVALHQGDQGAAVAGFESALATCKPLDDSRFEAEIHTNLGMTLGDLGVLEEAETQLRAAHASAERMNLRFVSTCALLNISLISARMGKSAEALRAGQQARMQAHEQGDLRIEGGASLYLSTIALLAGRSIEAEAEARAAVAAFESVPPMLPAALATLARALVGQGRAEEALACAANAYSLFEKLGYVEDGEAIIRLAYAEALIAADETIRAREILQDALDRLTERAKGIRRVDWQEAFETRIPENARTIELSRTFHLSPAMMTR